MNKHFRIVAAIVAAVVCAALGALAFGWFGLLMSVPALYLLLAWLSEVGR